MCNNTDLLSIIGIAKTVLRVLQIGIPIILLIIPVVIGIIVAMFFAALGTMSYYYY